MCKSPKIRLKNPSFTNNHLFSNSSSSGMGSRSAVVPLFPPYGCRVNVPVIPISGRVLGPDVWFPILKPSAESVISLLDSLAIILK